MQSDRQTFESFLGQCNQQFNWIEQYGKEKIKPKKKGE